MNTLILYLFVSTCNGCDFNYQRVTINVYKNETQFIVGVDTIKVEAPIYELLKSKELVKRNEYMIKSVVDESLYISIMRPKRNTIIIKSL